MAKNELCLTIPSYFRCPISLEVMKSPVSLSTGVTYDRSSIQAWLDGGHTTCPATMQPLSSPSFVPNLTLHRLIHLWSLSHLPPSPSSSLPSLISQLNNTKDTHTLSICLRNVLDRVKNSAENRRVLANSDDFLASIVRLWNRFGSDSDKIANLESVLLILDLILSESDEIREKIHKLIFNGGSNCLQKFVYVLRNGSTESKAASARILEKIAINAETKRAMIETPGLLSELYNLITLRSDASVEAGLSAMIAIARSRSAKSELVKKGIAKTVTEILCNEGTPNPVVQRSMEMLEALSTVAEGRSAICEEERCVAEIVRRLMKVSDKATEHGVTVVWSVCYLFPDAKAKETVAMSNGVAKCLLLLQSNCSPIVKQMCADLVKVLRVHSKESLSRYDTKTIHIMPY